MFGTPPAYTHVVNPRTRSLKITIDPSGEVIVSTPRFTPKLLIDAFVKKNVGWITAQRERVASLPQFNSLTRVIIFNQEYRKVVRYSAAIPSGIGIQGKELVFNPLEPSGGRGEGGGDEQWEKAAEDSLARFLKKTARSYIFPRTIALGQKMKTTFERISLKEQKTRWGSCSSRGNLNFNWRLVHFKPEIIDYVIIHELAHRTHMDHSHRFWQLVGQYDPEYDKHRGWLKRQGGSVG
jgi:predicted metal-dependent hydrolase